MENYHSKSERGLSPSFPHFTPMFEAELNFLLPPKTNRYFQTKNGIRFIPIKIKEAIDDAVYILSKLKPKKPIDIPCQLYVVYTLPNKRKRDLDNLNKTLQDCLEKAGVVEDDTLFFRTISEKRIIKGVEQVNIKIFSAQVDLFLPSLFSHGIPPKGVALPSFTTKEGF